MNVLAELEIFHSRPFAPTRRIALGSSHLPIDPSPGPGGILLGGVVARYRDALDEDLLAQLLPLTIQLQEGMRVVQPRLRHRFQTDRIGLKPTRHRLVQADDRLSFRFADGEAPGLPQILGAVYTAGRMAPAGRRHVMDAIRKGIRWGGAVDHTLIAHLSGGHDGGSWGADMYRDPVQWALRVLGLQASRNGAVHLPDRTLVQRRFRDLLREAHPDHGADAGEASQRIGDLTEARKILLSA